MTAIKIKDFRMSFSDKELDCKTPCSLYSVLYEKGVIDNPFFSDNWLKLSELSDSDCTFTADFEIPAEVLGMRNLLMRFSGIDTIALIELNGMTVGRTDNMHNSYTFDVKPRLRAGKNTLTLYFESPFSAMRARKAKAHPGGGEEYPHERYYLRKAELMSDGRFSPALGDMGILGEVEIIGFNHRIIDGVRATEVFEEGSVRFDLELDTLGYDESVRALATLVSPGGSVFYCGFVDGKGSISVKDPNLWWPRGLGVQNLYKLTVSLYCDGIIEDTREYRLGVRNLGFNKAEGCLTVAGERIFPIGAELLPPDSLVARITPEREGALVRAAAAANVNLVKIKGGLYPSDALLDALDECGVLLWLDITPPVSEMMMVADDRESIKEELIHNFRRMATHPCLAIITSEDAEEVCGEGRGEFLELLRSVYSATVGGACLAVDEEEEKGNGLTKAMREPYLSLPNLRQLSDFAQREDMNLFSSAMEAHSEGSDGNLKLIDELYSEYPFPSGISEIVYTTQLAAAERARAEIEEKRRERNTGGIAVFRRLNDSWPTISPSAIDYRQQSKALYYKAARFLAPLTVSAKRDGTRVKFYISNERRIPYEGALSYSLIDSDFKAVCSGGLPVSVDPLSSSFALEVDFSEQLLGREDSLCLTFDITEGATIASKGTLLFTQAKRFRFRKPKIDWQISGSGNDFAITISSDSLCLGVELGFSDVDTRFEDNFFDITSPAPLRIAFHLDDGTAADILRKQFTVRTLNEIGKSF